MLGAVRCLACSAQCNALCLQVSDAGDCEMLGSELRTLLWIVHAEATTSTACPIGAVVEPLGDQKPCVTMLNFDNAAFLGVSNRPVDPSPPSPMPAASLYTVVLPLEVEAVVYWLCMLPIAALALDVRNEKHNRWAWAEYRVARCPPPIQSAPVLRCYTRLPRVSAAGIMSTRTALLVLSALATTVGAALAPPSAPPPPPSPGSGELDGRRRYPYRTNLTAQVRLPAECIPSGNLPDRVGCVSVPRTVLVAHRSARFEPADCTLGTVMGCVRLPHASPDGGGLHGGGEVAFISSGAGFPGGTAWTKWVALGDANGDGRLDVLSGGNSATELLLLQSDDSFVVAAAGFPGGVSSAAALGDVDGDGRLDVLTGSQLLLQQSDGSFVAAAGFPGGSAYAMSFALGNFDGHGRLDVLVGNAGQTHKANELLLQQSDGSFVAAAGFPGGSASTTSVALGDVDGDWRLDVLVGTRGSGNELLLQQSDGSFVPAAGFPGGSAYTRLVALGDIDGDRRPDLSVGNYGSGFNQLLIVTHCPNGDAPLHATSICFACPSFMGRSSDSAICRECLPDCVSQGVFGTGERCVIPCTLGERPLGFNTCTACKAKAGTFSDASVERDLADPSTWAAPGCTFCPSGKRGDSVTGAVCLPYIPGQFAASNTGMTTPIFGKCAHFPLAS